MNRTKLKVIALSLLNIFLFEIVAPTATYALTGGPGQPEFQGFTEVDISQSVDPFTGDFSYQIPLLVVPGPNGGYPLNLTYSSGVGMEDEASWVGLGWSLTPGSINRSVRGIPDDFKGPTPENTANYDYVKQTKYLKPNVNASFGMSTKFALEVYGVDTKTLEKVKDTIGSITPNINLYYNSYHGNGFSAGVGINLMGGGAISGGLNLNFDPSDGPSVQPNISLSATEGRTQFSTGFGMGYSSRQGVTGYSFTNSVGLQNKNKDYNDYDRIKNKGKDYADIIKKRNSATINGGSSISYSTATGVSSVNIPMNGFNAGFQLDIEAGFFGADSDIPVGFTGSFALTKPADYIEAGYKFPAFGLLYSEHRLDNNTIENDRALMDFNLENEGPVNEKVPILSMPISTHDIYQISGDGLGGSFRAFRNDAGIFYKPKAVSNNVGVNIGVETAVSTGVKVALDPNVTYSRSYSGKWRSDDEAVMNMMGFRKDADFFKNGIKRNEPFTFRFPNEFLPNFEGELSYRDIGSYGPGKVNIYNKMSELEDISSVKDLNDNEDAANTLSENKVFKDLLISKAKTQATVNGIGYSANSLINKEPRRRANLIQYYTFQDTSKFNYPTVKNIYSGSLSNIKSQSFEKYANSKSVKPHHIKGFHVLKTDGSSAIYDIPLYNLLQKEMFFSVSGNVFYQNSNPSGPSKLINYNNILNTKKGEIGTTDRMYTENETSPYAHTYLLSYVTSADYIDIEQDGPSDDDLGYWAKFNYYPINLGGNPYKWRMPFEAGKANYSSGHHSDPDDDKASIMYGEKDVTYLHSIETKTHIAFFYLEDRGDAVGVGSIHGGETGGKKMKRLQKIELYSKNDLTIPLKTVHFEYENGSNELCQGIPNKSGSTLGKLTLKSVWFTYKNSSKGNQAKYNFEYGNVYKSDPNNGYLLDSTQINKNYSYLNVDRWGQYANNFDSDNPYTNQYLSVTGERERKESAVTWNLTKIKLPTGAIIRIDYEMDDYSKVQDYDVTQMVKILGTGRFNSSGGVDADWLEDGSAKIKNNDQVIFFEPLYPISNSLSHNEKMKIIEGYVSGLRDDMVYFKVWERLQRKNNIGQWMSDYVTGYAHLKKNSNNKPHCGYITNVVNGVSLCVPYIVLDAADNPAKHHFRAAGLQYLRYSRSDLNRPSFQDNVAPNPIQTILGLVQVAPQIIELMAGYYNASMLKGYCGELNNTKPSFLRLSNPYGKKFGGGIRVKKITVSDEWNVSGLNSSQYGSEYYYKMEDGTSSGVATYEPIIGNDENPMKRPSFYGPDNKFSNNDRAFFMESPIGESYFPAASVGYRRVVISNIANNIVRKTGDGINVKEFYTAAEFPIKAEFNKKPDRIEDKFNMPIPLIGSITISARGYSQGFYIELNDMHGKPKAEYLYDRDAWDEIRKDVKNGAVATGYSFNVYQTHGAYNPKGTNVLNSEITVIDKNGNTYKRTIGDVSEFFGSMAEDYNYSISAGIALNLGVDPSPYVPFGTFFPAINYNEESTRVISTTKVVNKVGVLSQVDTYKDGKLERLKNIYYDEETAQPILTAITDDYDNPDLDSNDRAVFTFQYPAHWYYSGMEPAYKNYRLVFKGNINNIPEPEKYFEVGDVIYDGYSLGYVSSIEVDSVKIVDEFNNLKSYGNNNTFLIVKSGKKNLQSVSTGKLVSLKNPQPVISSYNWAELFTIRYDSLIASSPVIGNQTLGNYDSIPLNLGSMRLCNGDEYYLGIVFSKTKWKFNVYSDSALTDYYCGIKYLNREPNNNILIKDLNFKIRPNKYLHYYKSGFSKNIISRFEYDNCNEISKKCMDGILHAEATEYSNDWKYRKEFTNSISFLYDTLNPFLKGERGIWRVKRVNSYFTERKQYDIDSIDQFGKTNIGYDGTYKRFIPFDWERIYYHVVHGTLLGNERNNQAEDGWRWAAEVPRNGFNPYGFEIENVNALGIYSSALYGYNNSLVTMTAQNAAYQEIAYDGFEEEYLGTSNSNVSYSSRGHLNFLYPGSNPIIINSKSHTGRNSMQFSGNSTNDIFINVPVYNSVIEFNNSDRLQFVKGKSYTISFWYHLSETESWTASVSHSGGLIGSVNLNNTSLKVEGWRRFEYTFKVPELLPSGTLLKFNLATSLSASSIILDDVRIHPTNASAVTYVYNPINYQLSAQLDDNNYATFYNYDEEGNLAQVKKETERGVMTIQQTRKNVKK